MATAYVGMCREAESTEQCRDERRNHHRLLSEAINEKARRDREDTVGKKERKWQEGRSRQAHMKTVDDVGNDGTKDVGEKGEDEKHEEHDADDEIASAHLLRLSSYSLITVTFVARSNFPASR